MKMELPLRASGDGVVAARAGRATVQAMPCW